MAEAGAGLLIFCLYVAVNLWDLACSIQLYFYIQLVIIEYWSVLFIRKFCICFVIGIKYR